MIPPDYGDCCKNCELGLTLDDTIENDYSNRPIVYCRVNEDTRYPFAWCVDWKLKKGCKQ